MPDVSPCRRLIRASRRSFPNKPFFIDRYVPLDQKYPSAIHAYLHEIAQIDGGKMDKFVSEGDSGALVMGYSDGRKLKLWKYARDATFSRTISSMPRSADRF